jgi:hypothetical protein
MGIVLPSEHIPLCCCMMVDISNDIKYIHTVEATGSIPVPPTIKIKTATYIVFCKWLF